MVAPTRHLPAVAVFLSIALLVTAPLWTASGTVIPGADFGDNVAALWSFWWARQALAHASLSLWETNLLFAPIGTGLVLHTGTPLLTVAGALAFPAGVSPAFVHNVFVALGVFLNGLCAYAAASRFVSDRRAACLAGIVFALSPCLIARLDGHLNLLHAWGLPLLLLLVSRLCARPTLLRGALAGLTLGAIAYVDYYYFVFGAVLAPLVVTLTVRDISVERRPVTRLRRAVIVGALAIAILAASLALAIHLTGGGAVSLGGRRISLTGTFNLRLAGWLALLIAGFSWVGPRVRWPRAADAPATRTLAAACAALVVTAIVALAPLGVEAFELVQSREYVSQRYRWRSAPAGVDVASLALGNRRGALWGWGPAAVYARAGIDQVESAAWLGLAPIALAIAAAVRLRRQPAVRTHLAILALFLVWSLGPFLVIWDVNTGWLLPQAFARYVPIINNARLPGRAFVIVALMTSLLAAAAWRDRWGARRYAFALTLAIVLADLWPAPMSVLQLDRPALDQTLRTLPDGVVLELPFGIRDGFGEVGRANHRALYYQTVHEQPLAGGFVARLAPHTREAYERDVVFGPLLALSAGGTPPPAPAAGDTSAESLACSVRYLVVDEQAPPPARRFALDMFDLEALAESSPRTLYRVRGLRRLACRRRETE